MAGLVFSTLFGALAILVLVYGAFWTNRTALVRLLSLIAAVALLGFAFKTMGV